MDKRDLEKTFYSWKEIILFGGQHSLFSYLKNMHSENYQTNIMEEDTYFSVTDVIRDLVVCSSFSDKFHFFPCNKQLDYASLAVCLLVREDETWKVSICEPWAIEACLCLFDNYNIPITKLSITSVLSVIRNVLGASDSAKGKLLEWLVAFRLIELAKQEKTLESLPFLQDIQGYPLQDQANSLILHIISYFILFLFSFLFFVTVKRLSGGRT